MRQMEKLRGNGLAVGTELVDAAACPTHLLQFFHGTLKYISEGEKTSLTLFAISFRSSDHRRHITAKNSYAHVSTADQ